MSHVIDVIVELLPVTCCVCGQVFGVSKRMNQTLRENHTLFYCPSGHTQSYRGKSEVELAKEEAERLRKIVDRERERTADLRKSYDNAQKDILTLKRVKTRLKNERDKIKTRVAHGVCPCCNRTFKQLSQHMKTQHPDYAAADGVTE